MQDILNRPPPQPDLQLAYGQDPNHFAELRVPKGSRLAPVVMVIHGGFWRAAYDLKHIGHLCDALRRDGLATFSVEYRRIGNPGGGWPGTLDDIAAAARFLSQNAARYNLDAKRITVTGHSAGGHLALWLAAEKPVPLRGAVSLAGVADLRQAYDLKLSRTVVGELLGGGPSEVAARYRHASPIERLPLKTPVRLIHGVDDDIVPVEISRRYEAAARAAGDDVRLTALPGIGHFELIDPQASPYTLVNSTLRSLLS